MNLAAQMRYNTEMADELPIDHLTDIPYNGPRVRSDSTGRGQAARASATPAAIVAGVVVFILLLAIALLAIGAGQARSGAPIETSAATSTGVPRVVHARSTLSSPILTPTVTPVPKPTSTAAPTSAPSFFGDPETIGTSVQGRPLVVYRLGTGPIKRALIGAIHGGYEWNTAELMTATLKHLRDQPDLIPPELTLYILPIANPDGYAAGTDPIVARMNGNGVDLNRNWDYRWRMRATHGTRPVSAGTEPFSEPETRAIRDFVVGHKIEAVIIYHSAYSAVFQGAGVMTSKTVELAKLIAQATGYRYAPEGVPGQITTGNAIDYLTVHGIDAIEVELATHHDLDWERNLRGIVAFLTWNLQ